METNKFKYCPRCKNTLSVSEFYKNKNAYDGIHSYCISCTKSYVSAPELRNKKNVRQRDWRAKNKEKYRSYYLKDSAREVLRKCTERYNQRHPGRVTENALRSHAKNRHKIRTRQYIYRANAKGTFPRASECTCNLMSAECRGRMEFHHYLGYSRKNAFDVIPLCCRHHKMVEIGLIDLDSIPKYIRKNRP